MASEVVKGAWDEMMEGKMLNTRFKKESKVQTTNGAWKNDNDKNLKKDRKEYYQQNNQITKSSCNDGIDKNTRKKPQKVAKFCNMSKLKFFN